MVTSPWAHGAPSQGRSCPYPQSPSREYSNLFGETLGPRQLIKRPNQARPEADLDLVTDRGPASSPAVETKERTSTPSTATRSFGDPGLLDLDEHHRVVAESKSDLVAIAGR